MFSFSQPINPVLRSHLDTQFAFMNDLSNAMSRSFQGICEANMTLSQTMLEECMGTAQRMLATGNAGDMVGAATAGAQPASEKFSSYQQHMSRIAADTQVDLSRVAQEHGRETSRTARALVDEVSRVSAEETERNLRQKEKFLKNFRNPFQQEAGEYADGGDPARAHPSSTGESAGMQSAGATGKMPEQDARPVQQPVNKQSGSKAETTE